MLARAFGAAAVPCIDTTSATGFAAPRWVTAPVRKPPPKAAAARAAASRSTAPRRRRGRRRTEPPTSGACSSSGESAGGGPVATRRSWTRWRRSRSPAGRSSPTSSRKSGVRLIRAPPRAGRRAVAGHFAFASSPCRAARSGSPTPRSGTGRPSRRVRARSAPSRAAPRARDGRARRRRTTPRAPPGPAPSRPPLEPRPRARFAPGSGRRSHGARRRTARVRPGPARGGSSRPTARSRRRSPARPPRPARGRRAGGAPARAPSARSAGRGARRPGGRRFRRAGGDRRRSARTAASRRSPASPRRQAARKAVRARPPRLPLLYVAYGSSGFQQSRAEPARVRVKSLYLGKTIFGPEGSSVAIVATIRGLPDAQAGSRHRRHQLTRPGRVRTGRDHQRPDQEVQLLAELGQDQLRRHRALDERRLDEPSSGRRQRLVRLADPEAEADLLVHLQDGRPLPVPRRDQAVAQGRGHRQRTAALAHLRGDEPDRRLRNRDRAERGRLEQEGGRDRHALLAAVRAVLADPARGRPDRHRRRLQLRDDADDLHGLLRAVEEREERAGGGAVEAEADVHAEGRPLLHDCERRRPLVGGPRRLLAAALTVRPVGDDAEAEAGAEVGAALPHPAPPRAHGLPRLHHREPGRARLPRLAQRHAENQTSIASNPLLRTAGSRSGAQLPAAAS